MGRSRNTSPKRQRVHLPAASNKPDWGFTGTTSQPVRPAVPIVVWSRKSHRTRRTADWFVDPIMPGDTTPPVGFRRKDGEQLRTARIPNSVPEIQTGRESRPTVTRVLRRRAGQGRRLPLHSGIGMLVAHFVVRLQFAFYFVTHRPGSYREHARATGSDFSTA